MELNKFKIFTIVFLCMFVFMVGVIYTNTKEMVERGTQSNQEDRNIERARRENIDQRNMEQNSSDIQVINDKIEDLTRRIDTLATENVRENESSGSDSVKCKIRGVMTDNGLESLSDASALNEAKINGKELVLTCSF